MGAGGLALLVHLWFLEPTWKHSSDRISEELVGLRRRGVGEVQVRSEVRKVGRMGWGRVVEWAVGEGEAR